MCFCGYVCMSRINCMHSCFRLYESHHVCTHACAKENGRLRLYIGLCKPLCGCAPSYECVYTHTMLLCAYVQGGHVPVEYNRLLIFCSILQFCVPLCICTAFNIFCFAVLYTLQHAFLLGSPGFKTLVSTCSRHNRLL